MILGVKVEKDGTLSATTQDGTVIGTMKEAVKSLDKKMIPAFRFETEAEGKAIAAFTGENFLADCFLICPDGALLRKIADLTYAARPLLEILKPASGNAYDVEEVRLAATKLGGKTVLLSAKYLTPALLTALRARSISVVAVLSPDASVAEIHNAVHCGVSGIATKAYADVLGYYKTITTRTLCITPLIVAHRGDPESHPDNMLRGLISGANSGATSIELDVWLTKDNHLVLNHDNVTTHFDKQLKCKEVTRAELEALTYTGAHAQAGDKIAFLDEVFAVFSKDHRDKILTIEVKDAREATIDRIVQLAKEYKMESNIVLIGMNHLISNYVYSEYSDDGISANMNQSYLVKKSNPSTSLLLGTLESTMLHSACFTQHSQEHPDFMKGIYHRLIKYSTWTSTSTSATLGNYLCGAPEYTTNFPHLLDDFYRYLEVETSDSGQIKVVGVTYAGDRVNVTGLVTLVALEGSGTFAGGKISGSGTFAFRLNCAVPSTEDTYCLYSPAVTQ
ncbi:MAG: hypothetical protein J6B77_09820 [Clostridia bacterium]|nr:hypothetical protein [Clostridia bacterium]